MALQASLSPWHGRNFGMRLAGPPPSRAVPALSAAITASEEPATPDESAAASSRPSWPAAGGPS